jgi:hypothetical protein
VSFCVKAILTGWLRSPNTHGREIVLRAGHKDKPEMFLKIDLRCPTPSQVIRGKKAFNSADNRMKCPIVPENGTHRLLERIEKNQRAGNFSRSSVSL